MSDQQVPSEQADEDQVARGNAILETFGRKSSFGAYQFLFDFWQAWMIDPERRRIAPLCRIILGDEDDGSVLIDKTVFVTGLLHLATDLAGAAAFNIRRASELPGFVMDIPGGQSHVIELIDDLEDILKKMRGTIEANNLFAADDADGN